MNRVDRFALENDIRRILIEHWDPFGVFGAPGAYDEYDSVVRRLALAMEASPSVEQLMDQLQLAEEEITGLETVRERGRPAAMLLARLVPTKD